MHRLSSALLLGGVALTTTSAFGPPPAPLPLPPGSVAAPMATHADDAVPSPPALPVAGMQVADLNIVIILMDDTGTDFLSMFDATNPYQSDLPYVHGAVGGGDAPGNGPGTSNLYIHAPNLAQLASQGVTFLNAYAQPMCSPTRACLYTGNYPIRHGIGNIVAPPQAFGDLQEFGDPGFEYPTLAELAQAVAMPAGIFGKWHLGLPRSDMDPQDGDDSNLGWASIPLRGHWSEWRCLFNGLNVHPIPPSGGNYFDYIINRNYSTHAQVLGDPTSFETEYATTVQLDEAKDWCNSQTGRFVCVIPTNAVHSPWGLLPPPELTNTSAYVNGAVNAFTLSCAMFEALDTKIGDFINGLDPAIRQDTLFIVMGDNGSERITLDHAREPGPVAGGTTGSGLDLGATYDFLLNDPVGRFKKSTFEKGIKVPLIVAGRGVVNGGRESMALVDVVDIFATVAELIGADAGDVHGVSFVPVLEDQVDYHTHQRDYTYSELFTPLGSTGPQAVFTERRIGCSVRIPGRGRYKIVRDAAWSDDRFYKLQDALGNFVDPFETLELPHGLGDPERLSYEVVAAKIDEIYQSGVDTGPGVCGPSPNFCSATVNSTGSSARISTNLECSVGADSMILLATPVPDQFGMFFYSAGTNNGGNGVPFGNGLLCIDNVLNDVYRLPVELATNHRLIHDLDIGSPPSASGQITAGSTWYFQAWFRDPIGGGSAFNLSDGRIVYFIP